MRYLLINPNASAHITARLAASAHAVLAPGETLEAVNAPQEPAVVRDAATLALADAQALVLFEAHAAEADAVLLGISLDGAAETLRARAGRRPVVGMTEAAVMSALLTAPRIGLLTPGNTRTQGFACEEAGEVYEISYHDVRELYFQNPEFGFHIMRMMMRRMENNLARFSGQKFTTPAAAPPPQAPGPA